MSAKVDMVLKTIVDRGMVQMMNGQMPEANPPELATLNKAEQWEAMSKIAALMAQIERGELKVMVVKLGEQNGATKKSEEDDDEIDSRSV
jgi:hypothetical protein